MYNFFLVAKVISVFGKNGFVRVFSFSDFPDRFFDLNKVYIDFFGDKKEFIVEEVNKVKDFFVIKFKNFDNEKDVRIFIGKEVFVDSENLVKLPEGYVFIHDLIGSVVLRNNVEIGIITDVLKYPANDVYVIKENSGNELLIPAVPDFIENFDPQKKILILVPGEDFYENDQDGII